MRWEAPRRPEHRLKGGRGPNRRLEEAGGEGDRVKANKSTLCKTQHKDSRVSRQSPTEADPGLDQASRPAESLLAKPSIIIRQHGREGLGEHQSFTPAPAASFRMGEVEAWGVLRSICQQILFAFLDR